MEFYFQFLILIVQLFVMNTLRWLIQWIPTKISCVINFVKLSSKCVSWVQRQLTTTFLSTQLLIRAFCQEGYLTFVHCWSLKCSILLNIHLVVFHAAFSWIFVWSFWFFSAWWTEWNHIACHFHCARDAVNPPKDIHLNSKTKLWYLSRQCQIQFLFCRMLDGKSI